MGAQDRGIQLDKITRRAVNYRLNYPSLLTQLKTRNVDDQETRSRLSTLLQHCEELETKHRPTAISPFSPQVMHTLFLIEEALDEQLNKAQFHERLTTIPGYHDPKYSKLGLLLMAFGLALIAGGFILPGATAAVMSVMGPLVTGPATFLFFKTRPTQLTQLTETFEQQFFPV